MALDNNVSDKPKEKLTGQVKITKRLPMISRLLVIFILIVGVGYLGLMYKEQDKAIDVLFVEQGASTQRDASYLDKLVVLENSVQELELSLSRANNIRIEQGTELERLDRELISTRLRVSESGTNSVWTLTEAESLLRLAQQRLILSKDVRAALALYVASDDILKQINDPAIFSIRNILASDMAALRAATEIDVQGMYLQLGVMSQSIDSLQLVSGRDKSLNFIEGGTTINEESGFFDTLVETLGEYIVVRRTNDPVEAMLSPEQGFYLKQTIKLQLEQAKLSLLQEREEIYRSSIESARTNIALYLESTDAKKQSILSSLDMLFSSPIVIQVPLVTNSLIALQQILPASSIVRNGESE